VDVEVLVLLAIGSALWRGIESVDLAVLRARPRERPAAAPPAPPAPPWHPSMGA
jgi:hypothetical protein